MAKARQDAITAASTGGAYGEGFVLVSSYGMVSANPAHFVLPDWVREWDYVILDEGHKIRNASTRWVGGARWDWRMSVKGGELACFSLSGDSRHGRTMHPQWLS